MKKLCIATLAVMLASSFGFGQMKQGTWGVTTGTAGSPTSFGIAYALQPNLRLSGAIGFTSESNPNFQATAVGTTTFTIGVTPWYYLGTTESVSAFVGGMIGFTSTSISGVSGSATGFTFAGHFGAEYWFTQKFAWNGYLALGFNSQSNGGPASVSNSTFGTSTSTGLTWFF